MTRRRWATALGTLSLLLAGAAAAGVLLGAEPVSLSGAVAGDETARLILASRIGQVMVAALVGAALGLSGTTLQALVENPLADPFVLGLSGGAAVGASVAIALGLGALGHFGGSLVGLASFAGALLATGIVFSLGRVRGRLVPERLLLVGVVFNAFASAIMLAIQSLVSPGTLQSLFSWLLGSIGHAPPETLVPAALLVAVGSAVLVANAPALNLLSLGELDAHGLGLDVTRARLRVFAASALLVAAAVSLAGVVGFVGLIVPHLVRLAFGSDHRVLVPGSLVGGAAFLVLADVGTRLFFRVAQTLPPVGMLTAVVGAPLFLHLLMRRTRRSER
jgi:iron complex transport system permease protein